MLYEELRREALSRITPDMLVDGLVEIFLDRKIRQEKRNIWHSWAPGADLYRRSIEMKIAAHRMIRNSDNEHSMYYESDLYYRGLELKKKSKLMRAVAIAKMRA